MSAELLRRAAVKLREHAEGASPGPWCFNLYSYISSGPKINPHGQWQDERFAEGHSLERFGPCGACNGECCQFYTEDYRRNSSVAKVPSHHGDTAIEHAVHDARLIEMMHPPVALALAVLCDRSADAMDSINDTVRAGRVTEAHLAHLADLMEVVRLARAVLRESVTS